MTLRSLDTSTPTRQSAEVPERSEGDLVDRNVDDVEVWTRATNLGLGPRPRGSQVDELLVRASDRSNDVSAETAVYSLSLATVSKRRVRDVTVRLLDIVDDPTRPPSLRGQAAEAVGNLLVCTKQAALRRHAILRLVKHLTDNAAEVRFWSAFSLGNLRARSARSALSGLVGDDEVLPGWWTVGEEAADALGVIAGRERPDREMRPRRPGPRTGGSSACPQSSRSS